MSTAASTGHTSNIIGISVDLEVVAKNQLRQILLGLDKTVDSALVTWSIRFELNERDKKADPWARRVKLNVSVKSIHNDLAQLAAQNGLTIEQTTYLLTTAAKATKDAQAAKDAATDAQAKAAASKKVEASKEKVEAVLTQ